MNNKNQNTDMQEEFNFTAHFKGSDYEPELDKVRLTGQLRRIYDCMKDGVWRTLSEISELTGDGESSISAQLRNLRKPEFGVHTVNRQRRGDRKKGLFEYSLIINQKYKIN